MFKERRETIALFGGSFDPPHIGHKTVVEEALKVLNIDTLMVVPTFLNPFKITSHFTAQERFELTEQLFSTIKGVFVDDFEIKEGKPTTTVKTLRHFQKNYHVKYVIVGADNLQTIDKWYEFEWLNSQITWIVATRAGYSVESDKLRDFKILDIDVDLSSTQIRKEMTKESS